MYMWNIKGAAEHTRAHAERERYSRKREGASIPNDLVEAMCFIVNIIEHCPSGFRSCLQFFKSFYRTGNALISFLSKITSISSSNFLVCINICSFLHVLWHIRQFLFLPHKYKTRLCQCLLSGFSVYNCHCFKR